MTAPKKPSLLATRILGTPTPITVSEKFLHNGCLSCAVPEEARRGLLDYMNKCQIRPAHLVKLAVSEYVDNHPPGEGSPF